MLSNESKNWLFTGWKVCYKMYLIPYTFDPKTNQLKFASRGRAIYWYFSAFVNICIYKPYWGLVFFIDMHLNKWEMIEIFVHALVCALVSLSTMNVFASLYCSKDYMREINWTEDLNKEMVEIAKIDLRKRDKYYKHIKQATIFCGSYMATLCPSLLFTTYLPFLHNFSRHLYYFSPGFFGKLLWAIGQTWIFYTELSHLVIIVSMTLFYMISLMETCDLLLSETSGLDQAMKRRIYRQLCIMHNDFCFVGRYLTVGNIGAICALAIVVGYLIIKHMFDFPVVLWLVLVGMAGILYVVSRVLHKQVTHVLENLTEFLTQMIQTNQEEESQRFWKSCRPLEFYFFFFTLTKESFNQIFFGVVLDQIINLVMSY